MRKLFLVLIFLIPFQARFYKSLKSFSLSWIDPSWQLPSYFERFADLFVSDFLLVVLLLGLAVREFDGFLRRSNSYFSYERVLVLFLGVALLSIVLSDYRTYLLPYWKWAHLALCALVVYAVRSWARSLKAIAAVVVLSATLECAIAIPQYLVQHQIGFKAVGEPTLVSKHTQAPHFVMPKNSVTLIDYLLTHSQEPTWIIRAAGTFPHANMLGGFLIFSLLMTCYLYSLPTLSQIQKGWVGASLILQILTLFITFSRGAFFAFLAAIAVWFFLHYWKEKKVFSLWKPILTGTALSFLLLFPQLFYRGGVVSYNEMSLRSDMMRLSMQDVAIQMIADHPWLGVGYNNYLIALEKYTHGVQVEKISVHNVYLLIAAETGLIGLAVFLISCGIAVYRGWQQRHSLEGRMLLALFLAYLSIGFIDYYPILFQQTRLVFFLIGGMLCSLLPEKKPSAITLAGC
jgi:hypothetical protein